MTEIVSKRVTYQELKDGTYRNAYIPQDNKFPVTSHLTTNLREALMALMYLLTKKEKKLAENIFLVHISNVGRMCIKHKLVVDLRS